MSDKPQKPKPARPEAAASGKPGNGAQDGGLQNDDSPNAGGQDTAQEASGWSKGEAEALKAENAELKDRVLRVAAEMENLRRRTERDKADTAKYAISNFARDVLTIADNIQRTIDHVPAEAAEKDPALKSFLEGVQVTERELLNVMERHGIARIDPKGERFDPNMHQAMFEVADASVPEGTIVQVAQPGYVIADRVLRPALVGVSKGGAKPVKETPKAANDDKPGGSKPDGDGEPPQGGPRMGEHVDKSA
ncbi:MAG: nucleotide exchange factor GrpE [Pseudomonadota bacterium]|nr:nucleotide exchange factor GrpE [Pseudomonadota bacterium]